MPDKTGLPFALPDLQDSEVVAVHGRACTTLPLRSFRMPRRVAIVQILWMWQGMKNIPMHFYLKVLFTFLAHNR
jgi:hypothetical protein